MIIFNEKDEIVENPDLSLGYLNDESIDVACAWIVDIPEVSHRETIAIYENGGRDVKTIIDTPEEGHWEIRNSDNEIVEHFDGIIPDDTPKETPYNTSWSYQRYILYTQGQLNAIEIARLKRKLSDTDYVAIKVYEAMVSEKAIPDEDATRYAEIIAQREEWRQQINQLESEVNQNGEHA